MADHHDKLLLHVARCVHAMLPEPQHSEMTEAMEEFREADKAHKKAQAPKAAEARKK